MPAWLGDPGSQACVYPDSWGHSLLDPLTPAFSGLCFQSGTWSGWQGRTAFRGGAEPGRRQTCQLFLPQPRLCCGSGTHLPQCSVARRAEGRTTRVTVPTVPLPCSGSLMRVPPHTPPGLFTDDMVTLRSLVSTQECESRAWVGSGATFSLLGQREVL